MRRICVSAASARARSASQATTRALAAVASGESVMRIGPHIVDLDVYAPDTNRTSFSRSYTDRSGQMTLKLYIYDSVTGDVIASVSDRQEAPHRGYASISNAVSNKADAQLMLTKWATALRERLDQARSH